MARSRGEGAIVQRKDGRWQASLQVDSKRRTVYGSTRKEAADKLAELKHQARTAGTLPDPGRRTLNDLLDAWLDTKKPTLKPRTLADYQTICDRYIRPDFGALTLAKVTPARIHRLIANYQGKGQHRTSLKVYRRLSQALALAVRWAWLPYNPCDRVDTPRYSPKRKELWTPDELDTFLAGTGQHWLYPLWVTAIATGCRLGELLALTWSDVDLDTGTIIVTKSTQRIKGERVTTTPKTASGRRSVTLPSEAIGALRTQRTWVAQRRLHLGPDWTADDLVFTSQKGAPLAHSTVEWAMQTMCERLGISAMTPHGLRHLHASLLLGEGLPVPVVAHRLGHANSAITMAVYAHVVQRQDDAAADAIGRAMGGHLADMA